MSRSGLGAVVRGLSVLAVVMLGCGPAKPPPGDPISNVAIDAAPAPAPGCPSAWGLAGTVCDPAAASGCAYAEGSCWCGVPRPCSGVDLGDDWDDGIAPTWQCTERPPEFREDGCPGVQPSGACWKDGQKCSYGDCCFQELTCQNGAWETTGGGCPP